jgi:hypothetical protein
MATMDFGAFDALTFDCYGTLIDWERGIINALQPVLALHGVQTTEDEHLERYASRESPLEAGTTSHTARSSPAHCAAFAARARSPAGIGKSFVWCSPMPKKSTPTLSASTPCSTTLRSVAACESARLWGAKIQRALHETSDLQAGR